MTADQILIVDKVLAIPIGEWTIISKEVHSDFPFGDLLYRDARIIEATMPGGQKIELSGTRDWDELNIWSPIICWLFGLKVLLEAKDPKPVIMYSGYHRKLGYLIDDVFRLRKQTEEQARREATSDLARD